MRKRILGALVKDGVLTEKQLEEVESIEAEEDGKSFDRVLREKGWCSEEKLLQTIHKVTRIPFERTLGSANVPKEFTERVQVALARTFNLVAIGRDESPDGAVVYRVATNEPFNYYSMDQIASLLEAEVEPVLAPRSEISALLNRAYQHTGDGVAEALEGVEADEDLIKIDEDDLGGTEDILSNDDKGPIIRLVNSIIFEGYRMRASDIHFQPFETKLQVRYRIDGILYDKKEIPKKVQDALISRLKVMSKMDIAERRLPQDGRASCKIGDGEVDIRFNSVPTHYGERIVLRLLDKTAKVFKLDDIGLSKDDHALVSRLIDYQHGIILVTGPTGSGKTTTLYACLSKINSSEVNCITIEDPIEYHLPGVSQIQVSSKKGLTFEKGLRALLRQDPDVMMVGEIRDLETARIAIQAALTGHLVFSTVHTNDSASTVTRLVDIGVEPYLVASSVIAVCAQRLVRVICKDCKNEYEPTEDELREIGLKREQLANAGVIHIGMGCQRCLDTGYLGRTAIYEILAMEDVVREQVMRRAPATEIKEKAVVRGLKTLRMDGARKVIEGHSTIEEVLRVTQLDIV